MGDFDSPSPFAVPAAVPFAYEDDPFAFIPPTEASAYTSAFGDEELAFQPPTHDPVATNHHNGDADAEPIQDCAAEEKILEATAAVRGSAWLATSNNAR